MAAVAAELLTFAEALETAAGQRLTAPARQGAIASVCVDSRKAAPGCLFVALPGERTDGHEFLRQAASAGALALLISRAQAARRSDELADLAIRHGVGIIAVPDTLAALQSLARRHMRKLPGVTRVGVTGSNGKTTTKEIIGTLLSRAAATAVNEGNLNSEIGLPLACFSVTEAHRFVVLEMGMNHRGEMDALADIVRPDLGLITNIGTAHIGLLGSREEIAKEKKKIFAHYDGRQTAFLPEDEPFRAFLADGVRGKILFYGPRSTPGYGGSESQGLGGTLIHWEGFRIRFPLFGPHNLANAIGAISVARELGVPNAEIRDGLEAVTPLFGRSQILSGPVTVIVDCYNANPDSMSAALSFIEELPWTGRKIAVLGGMRELGTESGPAHRALGERLRGTRLDVVYLFGEEMKPAWEVIETSLVHDRVLWHDDLDALGAGIESTIRQGDLVLLKGSRGLELERLLPRLTAPGRDQEETRC